MVKIANLRSRLTLLLHWRTAVETTTLSSKGQVIIPMALRRAKGWQAGLELTVIDTGAGLLLRPTAAFAATQLTDVAGMLKAKVNAKTDTEIAASLQQNVRRHWHGRG